MAIISHWIILVFMKLIASNLAQDTTISTSTESASTNYVIESTIASTANNLPVLTSFVNRSINYKHSNPPTLGALPGPDICQKLKKNECPREGVDLQVHWNLECTKGCSDKLKCCPQGNNDKDCILTFDNGYVNMISTCPSDYEENAVKNFCHIENDLRHDLWIMTPVTYSEDKQTYKNVFCAHCHEKKWKSVDFWKLMLLCIKNDTGVSSPIYEIEIEELRPRENGFWRYNELFCFFHSVAQNNSVLTGCASQEASQTTHTDAKFRLDDDAEQTSPKFSRCDEDLPKDLYELLCLKPEGKAKKCKFFVESCDISKHQAVSKNYTFYSEMDKERYKINSTTIYTCGPKLVLVKDTWVDDLLFVLLLLVRALLVGLAIYLLLFWWLPNKSTFDKGLTTLAVSLLLQCVCVVNSSHEGNEAWVSCRVLAILWHYSMLCSSSWILILSYDYWLNLYQIFSTYELVDEYDPLQYLVYLLLSQLIPAVATGAALFWDNGMRDVHCYRPTGSKEYECLLAEMPRNYFYSIPAAILFVGSTYYLARVGCLARRQRVPSSYSQRVRSRFTLAVVSPFWLLASLVLLLLLPKFEIPYPDWLLSGIHLLQGFSFLAVAFAQMMGRILSKFDEFERNAIGDESDQQVAMGSIEGAPAPELEVLFGHCKKRRDESENIYV